MQTPIWKLTQGDSPLIATAIHDGHAVRGEIAALLAVSPEQRFREEDPFSGEWVSIAPTQIRGIQSRFEVDLNRSPDMAVYIQPEDAWGLTVWQDTPPVLFLEHSRAQHAAFYDEMRTVFSQIQQHYGHFVVFDFHTYNHRRGGRDAPFDAPERNPEINVGTSNMNRQHFGGIVDRFIDDLRQFDYMGRRLDVRENVRWRGGYFARWTHDTFPDQACVLNIEVKKIFMDEWSGEEDAAQIVLLRQAFESTIPGILAELEKLS